MEIAVGDRPWPDGRLLGVVAAGPSVAAALVDWHIRGDDLIASYETGEPDAARVDLLWHAAQPEADDHWLARIDLLVSIRTDRLDWRHDVRLESVLPQAAMVPALDPRGMVFTAAGWSLAVMVHPADLGRWELSVEAQASRLPLLRHRLFRTRSLEKGVILRGRARAWFLPPEFDAARIAECFAAFAAAAPPLD